MLRIFAFFLGIKVALVEVRERILGPLGSRASIITSWRRLLQLASRRRGRTEIWSHKHTHKHIKNHLEGWLGLSCLVGFKFF
ncbi:hypothetical protein L1987_79476 [Smallanthus sonchifolius]|uniref:Uncharacterized protein n=1 Tax=Smallanthus sonchifolius TaxID=185202 RepID=A0ACB8ZK06_9ASTR|nr:hypothetical protein L1987_79476 [Smallanthus sonchifolius]